MTVATVESFDRQAVQIQKIDVLDKFRAINKSFASCLTPENGVYGSTTFDKGNGALEVTSRNELGHVRRDYYQDSVLTHTREKISDTAWKTTRYDDNGTAYLSRVSEQGVVQTKLTPNVEIHKGNFSAVTDRLGRPIKNKLTDVKLRTGEARESLSNVERSEAYRPKDERGHIMADNLGGPADAANVVPQEYNVNHGQFREVEQDITRRVEAGEKVDYEIKTNYADDSGRPSSFEVTVTSNGEVVNTQKIYNEESTTRTQRVVTTAKETYQKAIPHVSEAHKAGKQAGMEAALITGAVSTVEHVSSYIDGDISAEEMVVGIAKDTGTAAAIGYGTGFISSAVAQAAAGSSHELLQSLGKSGVPAAVIAFGVTSYDTVVDYAQGEIDTTELAYDLGENAVGVAGSTVAAAAGTSVGTAVGGVIGGAVGSVVPVAGTVAGAAVGASVGGAVGGFVGGMAGYEVSTVAYEAIGDVVETIAEEGVDAAVEQVADAVETTFDDASETIADGVSAAEEKLDHVAEKGAETAETLRNVAGDALASVETHVDAAMEQATVQLDLTTEISTSVDAVKAEIPVDTARALVSGAVSLAVTSEAYQTAVAAGSEAAGALADKAQNIATNTLNIAKEHIPESADSVKSSINTFAQSMNLPFSL